MLGDAGGADPLGVDRGLLVSFDNRERLCCLQRLDGLYQQRRLARTGARYEIEGENSIALEPIAVDPRMTVILGQNVPLDDHQIVLAMPDMRVAGVVTLVVPVAATAYAAHILCLLDPDAFQFGANNSSLSRRISSRMRCMMLFSSS